MIRRNKTRLMISINRTLLENWLILADIRILRHHLFHHIPLLSKMEFLFAILCIASIVLEPPRELWGLWTVSGQSKGSWLTIGGLRVIPLIKWFIPYRRTPIADELFFLCKATSYFLDYLLQHFANKQSIYIHWRSQCLIICLLSLSHIDLLIQVFLHPFTSAYCPQEAAPLLVLCNLLFPYAFLFQSTSLQQQQHERMYKNRERRYIYRVWNKVGFWSYSVWPSSIILLWGGDIIIHVQVRDQQSSSSSKWTEGGRGIYCTEICSANSTFIVL